MKKVFLILAVLSLSFGCSNNTPRNNNPYLPSYNFSAVLNLNLPLYNGLTSNLQPVAITVDGDIDIVIMKVGGSDYRAWNGNCPNQYPTSCSRLSTQGLYAKCGCEDAYQYSMFTGIATGAQYTMLAYRVEVLGNNQIRVYN